MMYVLALVTALYIGKYFLKKDNIYTGIYAENGYELTKSGPFKDKEIISKGSDNFWLIKLSTKEEIGCFESCQKILWRYHNTISFVV